MTDRELLELAAKAAGYQVVGNAHQVIAQGVSYHALVIRNERGGDSVFDPLDDDGDALRLAVKLSQLDGGVTLMLNSRFGSSEFAQCTTNNRVIAPNEFMGDDPYAATRRAIVRAAAAIGASQ